jgi:RNA-directed DNA polymerase
MKRSYRKDVAHHPDPKSCGAGRKARHEALTGADAGEVSSREIRASGSPTLLSEAEGNMQVNAKASSPADSRGRRPFARIEASSAGTGRPHAPPRDDNRLERPAKAISQTAGRRGYGESDESVVSKKPANRIQKTQWGFSEAELAEKRDSIKRNAGQLGTSRTQSRNQRCHPGWNVCVETHTWDRFDARTQDKSRVR